MTFKNYYSILETVPQATQKEITDAYKTLAKKWHPDKNNGIDTTAQMQLITEAYGILKDKEKRKTYNSEYYNFHQAKSQRQPDRKVKLERCYYCNQNIANPKFAHNGALYKVTGHSNNSLTRKVRYQTLEVSIPRCEICNKIHGSRSLIFFLLPFISFPILGIILGVTIWNETGWFMLLWMGAIVGLFSGTIFSYIDESIIAKEAGIKMESNINDYEPIVKLIKEGWSTNKPEA
jgi:hypothetical protein